MKHTQIAIGILAIVLPLGAQAIEFQDIERASFRNDRSALTALENKLTRTDGEYVRAYLKFRQAIAAKVDGDADAAKKALEHCANLLEKEMGADGENVESLALLANCYGMVISISPIKGPVLGPKSDRAMEKAMELDADNPRALLIDGIAKLNTPGLFGGSNEKAEVQLNAAIKAFSVEDAIDPYNWGHAEAYLWRALARQALDNSKEAIEDLDQALVVEPEYKWARVLRQQWSAR